MKRIPLLPGSALAVIFLVLFLAPARAAPPLLGPGNRDFDQIHLALKVEPHIRQGTIDGDERLTFASLVDGLRILRLHCLDTTIHAVTGKSGKRLTFSLAKGVLSVTLSKPLAKGKERTVEISYRAVPKRGMYFHFPTKRYPFVPLSCYSQGEGEDNRHWFPCYDEPDDRMTVELTAVIPDALHSVGNGVLAGTKDLPGPKKEETWRMDSRLPSYLVCLAVGPYQTFEEKKNGVVIQFNAFPGQLDLAKETFRNTPDILAFYASYLGVPYPYPRYAQTFVWDFLYGGMENTTATTMNLRILSGPETLPFDSGDGVVAHELAHDWFGDDLTCRTWSHIWLNEGFATYLADLWIEHSKGRQEFEVAHWRETQGYLGSTPAPQNLGLSRSERGDQPLELFGGKQYSRGSAILHMLRLELGDDVFRAGLHLYLTEHADSAVVSEDLRRSMEEAAGRDLSWFFDQWVYGAGYPVVDVRVHREAGAVGLTVTQKQAQGGGQGLFRFTLPVRIETTKGSYPTRLEVRDRTEEYRIPITGNVLHVRVDDGAWLLGRATVEQGFAAWADQAQKDPDPVGRIVAVVELLRYADRGIAVIADVLGKDKFWAVRRAAADALGKRAGSEAARDALLAAVADADARVRESVVRGLSGFDRDHVAAALSKVIAKEPNPIVRSAAAHSLGRVHAVGAFATLTALLSVTSPREVVRQGALEGLTALGDPRAVPLAKPFLDYRFDLGAQSRMRHAALDLVLKLAPDDRETGKTLIALLGDPYSRMRAWAVADCGRYGVESAVDELRRVASSDPDGGIRNLAARTLKKLVPPKKK